MPKLARDTKQRQFVPFTPREGTYKTFTDGGTVSYDPIFYGRAKESGAAAIWQLTCPPGRQSGGTNPTAWVQFPFYGEAVGLQLYRMSGSLSYDPLNLDVRVDGRQYELKNLRMKWRDDTLSLAEGMGYILIDDELPATPDGRPHLIEIGLVGDPADQSTPKTTLGSDMTTSTTGSVTVGSTTGFPASGVVLIDQELIAYSAVVDSTHITVSTRAQRNSTAQAHNGTSSPAVVRVSQANTRIARIGGLIVDKVTGGYAEPAKQAFIVDTIATPTSLTTIQLYPTNSSTGGVESSARAISKLIYCNTGTATTVKVNINISGDLQAYQLNLAANGTAGDTGTITFERPIVLPVTGAASTSGRFRHVAGQAGVNCTIIGEA